MTDLASASETSPAAHAVDSLGSRRVRTSRTRARIGSNGSNRLSGLSLVVVCVTSVLATGCASTDIPSPRATLDAYAAAARKGDSHAIYDLMSERSQQAMGREGVERAVGDARSELAEQAGAATSAGARVEASAKVRFRDGEEATLELEDGVFRVSSADALPAGAKTPAQALDQLRTVLARRSYAGLMRVLSKETRRAIEQDFRSLVEGLERPEGLDVKVQGDKATVQISGGHLVRLKRENGLWRIEDFD